MPRRTRATLTLEEMAALYASGLSLRDVGLQAGISDRAVAERLARAGIERRNVATTRENHIEVTESLIELIDGLLLGDGAISKKSPRLVVNQSVLRADWLRQVAEEMTRHGLTWRWSTSKGGEGTGPEGRTITRTDTAHLNSHAYVELRPQRLRWYGESGLKVLPNDVRLTQRSLAHWLCGDGSLIRDGSRLRYKFSTESFAEDAVARLAEQMASTFGVRALKTRKTEGQYVIYINTADDVVRLADVVRPFMPLCCRYKLPP